MASNAIISKTKIEKPKTDNMKWLPLILIESYLILTLLIYQFGLFKWDTQNTFKFWIYIILYHIAFIAGYIWIAPGASFATGFTVGCMPCPVREKACVTTRQNRRQQKPHAGEL